MKRAEVMRRIKRAAPADVLDKWRSVTAKAEDDIIRSYTKALAERMRVLSEQMDYECLVAAARDAIELDSAKRDLDAHVMPDEYEWSGLVAFMRDGTESEELLGWVSRVISVCEETGDFPYECLVTEIERVPVECNAEERADWLAAAERAIVRDGESDEEIIGEWLRSLANAAVSKGEDCPMPNAEEMFDAEGGTP